MSELGYIFTAMETERDRLEKEYVEEGSLEIKGKRDGVSFCIGLFWEHFLKKTEAILEVDRAKVVE